MATGDTLRADRAVDRLLPQLRYCLHTMPPHLSFTGIENALHQGTLGDLETTTLHTFAVFFSQEDTGSLIASCEALLHDCAWGEQDRNRVGAVKLLVALLPRSLDTIREWMFRMDDPYVYEVQFTVWCFLSDTVSFAPPDPATVAAVLDLAKEYLDRVPSDEAQNAFMAADMLGDHWVGDAGIAALVDVARTSANPVGRKAAIGGLRTALAHGKVTPGLSLSVTAVIERETRNARNTKHRADPR